MSLISETFCRSRSCERLVRYHVTAVDKNNVILGAKDQKTNQSITKTNIPCGGSRVRSPGYEFPLLGWFSFNLQFKELPSYTPMNMNGLLKHWLDRAVGLSYMLICLITFSLADHRFSFSFCNFPSLRSCGLLCNAIYELCFFYCPVCLQRTQAFLTEYPPMTVLRVS